MGLRSIVSFDEFKKIYARKRIATQCHETANAHELTIIENGHEWYCPIYKEGYDGYDESVHTDFTSHKGYLRLGASVEKRAEDGRMLTQPVTLDSHLWHRMTSVGDSATTIGEGQPMCVFIEPGEANKTIDIRFRDWVQVIGGKVWFQGGEVSRDGTDADWVSLRVIVPSAHALTVNPNGTGNAMVFMQTVLPRPGDGTHDLDLTKTSFVEANGFTGFWDWDWPDKHHGSLRPNFQQNGEFHVITPDLTAVEFIGKSFLLGEGTRDYTPPNPHPTYIYPGYVLRAEFHKISNGTSPLIVVSELQTARKATI